MGYYKIKVNRADKLFSDFVREKAGWKCEKCGKVCKVNGANIAQLDASHYFVRSKWNVRYDLDNVHAICNSCHRRMGEYRNDESGEYDLWMKEKLGDKRYKLLKLRANMTGRRDPALWLLHVKQLIKDHNANKPDIPSDSDERATGDTE